MCAKFQVSTMSASMRSRLMTSNGSLCIIRFPRKSKSQIYLRVRDVVGEPTELGARKTSRTGGNFISACTSGPAGRNHRFLRFSVNVAFADKENFNNDLLSLREHASMIKGGFSSIDHWTIENHGCIKAIIFTRGQKSHQARIN